MMGRVCSSLAILVLSFALCCGVNAQTIVAPRAALRSRESRVEAATESPKLVSRSSATNLASRESLMTPTTTEESKLNPSDILDDSPTVQPEYAGAEKETTEVFFKLKATSEAASGSSNFRTSFLRKLVAYDDVDVVQVFDYAGRFEPRHRSDPYQLHLYYVAVVDDADVIGITAASERIMGTARILEENEEVEEVEIRSSTGGISLAHTPDDYYYPYQDHFGVINMEDAWDIECGSEDIVVQVLDTGVYNHPDLYGSLWENPGEVCGDGIDNDNNGYIDDCNGYNFADGNGYDLQGSGSHGTHVAGTLAARTDNWNGVAGVAGGCAGGGPGVKLMIGVLFGNTRSASNSQIANAIVYAADNGAAISTNSWTFSNPDQFPNSVKAAIDYFNSVAYNGAGVMVAAAGNMNNQDEYYPAAYSGVVSVGNVKDNLEKALHSSYGPTINITGPGTSVASTWQSYYYKYKSGTSMSAPHVSGTLALMMSHNPNLSRNDYLDCLYSTAMPHTGTYYELGAGCVDAAASLSCIASR